jgi:hypothetical protein
VASSSTLISLSAIAIRGGQFTPTTASLGGAILRDAPTISQARLRQIVGRSGIEAGGPLGVGISVAGLDQASRYLTLATAGVIAAATSQATIRSDLPYAYGIQFGWHRGGRLARRAGGTYSLLGAYLAIQPQVAPQLAAAIPNGPQAVQRQMEQFARRMLSEVRTREVRQSGQLRRSYYAVTPRTTFTRGLRGL